MINYRQQNPLIFTTISIILLQLITTSNNPKNHLFKQISTGLLNSPALAQSLPTDIQYTPPDRGAPRATGSGGGRAHEQPAILQSEENWTRTRGTSSPPPQTIQTVPKECVATVPTLLVPQNHLGLTTSSHPTFQWYLPNKNVEFMMFELRKAGEKEPIYAEKLQPVAGIIQMQLPKDKAELEIEQEYNWAVSVSCVAEGKRRKISVEAGIKRVAPTPALTGQLAQATTPQQKARVYAQNGYWYNALETLSAAYTANPNESTYENILSLLDQVGLNEITKKERQQ